MKYYKDIPVKRNYDFIVCGGGMTGFAAAVTAARKGVSTAIVEKQGCLGGVATSAGVNHLLGAKWYDEEHKRLVKSIGGIFDEVSGRLIENNAAVDPYTINFENNPHGWYSSLGEGVPFDSHAMKAVLDDICLDAGVDIYYFTDIIDVVKEGSNIKSVIVHNKSGLFALEGRCFADTTGDADIAFLSGCPTRVGRDEDNLMGPASLEMHVENVDEKKLGDYIKNNNSPRFRELIQMLRQKGEWTFPYEIFISVQLNYPDVFMINTIRQIGIDGTDGDSITKGIIEGRKENLKLFELMKKYFPGFENARIRFIADVIGIRETRRIVGEYVMTVEDLIEGKGFEDSIACSSYGWDLPDPKRPSYQPANDIKRKKTFTQIPYRCLITREVENMIVAGRCISVERDVLGPVRVMGPCMAMGQTAGLATVIALKKKDSYLKVEVNELQKGILDTGGLFKMPDDIV